MTHDNDNPSTEIDPATLDPSRLPRHVAVIMDGNGRWACERGLPRIEGHRRGATIVQGILTECVNLKLDQLTLYCLSSENWKRPQLELDFLMALLKQYIIDERPLIMEKNVRLHVIGRREGIPDDVWAEVEKSIELSSANTGTVLCLAINYGGRGEIVDATRAIAQEVAQGELAPDSIDEQTITDRLYTAGMPDPDLMIRTASEFRVSNFLLWQISYAELWVTKKYWPDFDKFEFRRALADYASRERRFGGLDNDPLDDDI